MCTKGRKGQQRRMEEKKKPTKTVLKWQSKVKIKWMALVILSFRIEWTAVIRSFSFGNFIWNFEELNLFSKRNEPIFEMEAVNKDMPRDGRDPISGIATRSDYVSTFHCIQLSLMER